MYPISINLNIEIEYVLVCKKIKVGKFQKVFQFRPIKKKPNQIKGQIISECPYEIIVSPKIPKEKFPRFLP